MNKDESPKTGDGAMFDELIVYRVDILPEVLPMTLFSDGVKHFEVTKGLPEGVHWLRSGWDYGKGCLYVEYSNKNMEGELIPDGYKMVRIYPTFRNLTYEEQQRRMTELEYKRFTVMPCYDENGGEL